MDSRSRGASRCRRLAVLLGCGVILSQAFVAPRGWAADSARDKPLLPPLELKLDSGALLTIKGTVTYGTNIRARGRDPELIPPGNAARVGAAGVAPGGVNVDDPNLNYDKGDRISTALKGVLDLELKFEKSRAFVRARAWDDYAQRRNAVPHGNLPNAYTANTPLSDAGSSAYAQFNSGVLMDAYVEHTFDVGARQMLVRLGSQRIDWGRQDTTILGGLEQINAIDYAARIRAGALPQEGYVPVPAVFARWGTRETTAIEAFYLLKFHENEQPACGTFGFYGSLADYTSDGCNRVVAQPAGITDPAALTAGIFARRAPDVRPSDSGQYGISVIHVMENVGQFGAYFANYHSRRFSPSALKSTRVGPPLIPGDPGGANVQYFIEYPENVRMFGLTYGGGVREGSFKGAQFGAEYTYRPNQPVLLSSTDLFNAFASNVAPTQLRADATATPLGGRYPGYDRRKISQLTIAGQLPTWQTLGGYLVVKGEAGMKYVHDLPDVNVRRYVRSEVYGLGPVNGVCLPGSTPKQCSNEGYVTPFSWGYRASAGIKYANVIPSAAKVIDLTPSISFVHDVSGYAYDIIFIEGRKITIAGLKADIGKNLFLQAQWWNVWGGDFNFLKDRDFVTLFGGINF